MVGIVQNNRSEGTCRKLYEPADVDTAGNRSSVR